jgi:hypothetical protein
LSGGLLFGKSDLSLLFSLDSLGLLGGVELDVTVLGQVWGHSTVGSVSSSSSSDSSLDNDVSDVASFGIESFGFTIVQEVLQKKVYLLGRLFWPSSLGVLVYFSLSRSSNSSGVLSEWNDLLML